MSMSAGAGKGKERQDGGSDDEDIAGPYIMRPLAIGLQLGPEEALAKGNTSAKARRPSLSQRLGFGSGKEPAKGPEEGESKDASPAGDTPDANDNDCDSVRSSSPMAISVKAECVEVAGSDMYVGTSHGHIVHYTVAMVELDAGRSGTMPEHFRVSSVDLKLGGKRVEQVLAFPVLNRLVVLCGSTAQVLSLPDLRPVPGTMMKGVSCLSYDERLQRSAAAAVILCVARVRSIQLYRMAGAELRLELEVPITCSVASLCQYGQYLCVADTEAYKILDLAKLRTASSAEGARLELFPTQQPRTDPDSGRVIRPPRPRTLVVGPNEFMFLTSSASDDDATTLGVIVTALGEAQRGTLQFASYPKSVVYAAPFIIVTFAGSVDVYDTRQPEQTLAQRLFVDVPDAGRPRRVCAAAGFLAGTRLAQLDRESEPSMSRALSAVVRASIVAVSQDSVYVLADEPPLLSVSRMLRAGRIEEAVAAVDAALASGDVSQGSAEARYCVLMAGVQYFARLLLDDALQLFRRGSLDPRALLHVYADYAAYLGPLLEPLERLPMPATLHAAIRDLGSVARLVGSSAADMAGNDCDQEALAEALSANALEVLERYLEHVRLSEEFDVARTAVDTALARLYADNDHIEKFTSLIGSRDSHVDNDVAIEFCRNTQRHYYESLVHRARGEPRKVLDIWRRLLSGEWEDARFGGMPEYMAYVETLTEQQGILLAEYAWLVDIDVAASLRVLVGLTDASVATLDADRAMAAIQSQKIEGGDRAQRALIERLIGASHPRASHYLTYLLNVYVRQVRDCYSGDEERHRRLLALEERFRCAQAEDLRLTFRAWIAKAAAEDKSDALESQSAIRLRAQLIAMLSARPIAYDAAAVLDCVEREAPTVLHLERAMLMAALGNISDAGEFLVTACQDYAEAELLLMRPYAPESLVQLANVTGARRARAPHQTKEEEAEDVHHLLGLYMAHVDDEMAARLVADILHRYSECLCDSGGDVLVSIPEHWPYAIAEPLVSRQLARLAHRERSSGIERGLRQSLALAEQLRAIDEHRDAGPIVLDYSQACAKCHKLLGSSAFVLVPESREIRHVSCG
ncbi:hypothetical protein GGI19_004659 [Coemansia pectinata]|uniref:CNH domain-containing protein n=1 Tax=Coemansia pectinata TaxID=1052879 RepID=A0A9W8GVB0_9FUNG|nr:hypothetical protein GGI19_004659 [Coemansia pectinata]